MPRAAKKLSRKHCVDQLGAGLAVRIRVVPAEPVAFAIAGRPPVVGIAFVGGDRDDCARGHRRRARASRRFAVPRTLVPMVSIGSRYDWPDQWLRGEVEDDLRLRRRDDRPTARRHRGCPRRCARSARRRRSARTGRPSRAPAKSRSLGAKAFKQQQQPAALEAGMARQEDPAAPPEPAVQAHIFHGAS